MLGAQGSFNAKKAAQFVRACQMPDGGFGLRPKHESHGGAVYTGVASLVLLQQLDGVGIDKKRLIRWCHARMVSGDPVVTQRHAAP